MPDFKPPPCLLPIRILQQLELSGEQGDTLATLLTRPVGVDNNGARQ